MVYKFGKYEIEVYNTGTFKTLKYQGQKINLVEVSEIDNPLINVYVKENEKIIGLLDTKYPKILDIYENGLKFSGKIKDLSFEVIFIFADDYYIEVNLSKPQPIIYAQDIGLGASGNTLYSSQYLDNKVIDQTILMRKTLMVDGKYPLIQMGSLSNKIVNYATEGFDFYRKDYRIDKKIKNHSLKSRMRNYELGFIALEVSETKFASFYGHIEEDYQKGISETIKISKNIKQLGEKISSISCHNFNIKSLNGQTAELENGNHSEIVDNKLLSYFNDDHSHVITQEKELLVDRSHANIITSKSGVSFDPHVLVSTNYMSGIFWAQNSLGNTQFNSYNKNLSSYLDFNKLEGLRIYIKVGSEYQILNLPSFYEVGFNYSKWVYLLEDNEIEIVVYTSVKHRNLKLQLKSQKSETFLVVDQLNESFEIIGNCIIPKKMTLQSEKVPNLKYEIKTNSELKREISEDNLDISNAIIFKYVEKNKIDLELLTTITGQTLTVDLKFEQEKKAYIAHFQKYVHDMKFSITGPESETVKSFNPLMYWYLHNSLIHYATPHGVEQHGGAAFGTRDVCQGPLELFFTFGHYDVAREVIIKIFENQFYESGNWPQWFMFDEYDNIRAAESHGDIIAWPLKALANYLDLTNDFSILEEEVPYYLEKTKKKTDFKETVNDHLNREIKYIEDNFIEGTYLSKYNEGDWDDTLQPANDELRSTMVSGWTVPLTFQGLKTLGQVLVKYNESEAEKYLKLAENISLDYRKYLIKDGIAAGFIQFKSKTEITYLLHPRDNKTNIKYRLLPINRSIISGLFTKDEISNNLKIIDDHLLCNDGVRLMDRPVTYSGGTMNIFQRGEAGSTVGREISLLYVHAHIRYIEAMTILHQGNRAYQAIKQINPINLQKNVNNANLRQSNSYFSSSEGDFNNRYDYEENFDKLKNGEIMVRGGWRIYSSGPGIFLHQLISNYFGLKFENDDIKIKTAVGQELSGLEITLTINDEKKFIRL